jgi:glycosyltransferase involved in cell wall biosynthesis
LCDGGSTDDTLAIAREYGARLIAQDARFKNPDGTLKDYAGVRNQYLAAAKNRWLLSLDSDEGASKKLVEEIKIIVESNTRCAGYRVPERFVVAGRLIEQASGYPGYQYRLIRTDAGVIFRKPVHERPVFAETPPPTCTLMGPWYVYWEHEDVDNYMRRNNKYIEIELARLRDMSAGVYIFRFIPRNLRSMLSIFVKSIRNRILHPLEVQMPLRVERGRIRYHWRLMTRMGRTIFS